MKTMNKKYQISVLVLVAMCGLFGSCGRDMDDYLHEKDLDVVRLQQEDQRLRTQLNTSIAAVRAELLAKIAASETEYNTAAADSKIAAVLATLDGEKAAFNALLTTEVAAAKLQIASAAATMDAAITAKKKDADAMLDRLDTEMLAAIAAGDADKQAQITATVSRLATVQAKFDALNATFLVPMANLEAAVRQLEQAEEDVDRLNDFFENIPDVIDALKSTVLELVEERLANFPSEELLAIDEKIEALNELYEEYLDKISDLDDLVDNVGSDLDNFRDRLADMESKFYDFESDIDNLYSDASSFDELDLSEWEAVYDTYLTEMEEFADNMDSAAAQLEEYTTSPAVDFGEDKLDAGELALLLGVTLIEMCYDLEADIQDNIDYIEENYWW
jgi:chromosome segregation ATPase